MKDKRKESIPIALQKLGEKDNLPDLFVKRLSNIHLNGRDRQSLNVDEWRYLSRILAKHS